MGVLPGRQSGWRPEALTTADLAGIASRYAGRVVGDGQCVALVREVCALPPTSRWRAGAQVRDVVCEPGTPIATFNEDGRYANSTDGSSHCAVLVEAMPAGLEVWDQWRNRPVHRRLVRYKRGEGPPADDGDAYRLIEIAG